MEGIILAVSPTDKPAKKLWQSVFLKLDDITARLVAFTDRSQFCVQWSVPLVGADIATPVPGEPNHGVNVDETPFCFYVRSPTEIAGDESCHYLAAPSDAVKKQWVAALLQIAKHGPREPRFATTQSEHDFSFRARVVKFRIHKEGKYAEYMVTCSCQVFSKLVARRLSKQWNVWHRFSKFDALNEAVKVSLGAQLAGIDFVKHHRDAFRSLLGKALEHEFLEARRLQLDTYVTRVCDLRSAVEFFKHHADPNLKKFFLFDENCQDVDETNRNAKGSRNKERKASGNRSQLATSSRASESGGGSQAESLLNGDKLPTDKLTSSERPHHHKHTGTEKSGKRERRASKKKDKSKARNASADASSHEDMAIRGASPTSAH